MAVSQTTIPEKRTTPLLEVIKSLLVVPETGILIPLIFFVVLFNVLNPIFLSGDSISSMLRAMSYVGVIAVGQVFLMVSGQFDLSVGSTAGLAAIVSSYLMAKTGWAIPPAIIAGLVVGALVGLANGIIVVKLKIPAFIATLGMLYIARGLTNLITQGYSIYPLPPQIKEFGAAQPLNTSWPFFIFLVLAILGDQVLRRTIYGRMLYATGGNKEVARLAGINVDRVQISAFILVGTLAAAGGILLMAKLATGQPTIGQGWELNVIAAVVIGGVSLFGGGGTVAGAVLGLSILQVINNGLVIVQVDPYWQTSAIGIIMILAVGVDLVRRRVKMAA